VSHGGLRRSRELALQVLYAIDLGPRRCGRPPDPAREVDLAADHEELEAALAAAAAEPAAGRQELAVEEVRRVFDAVGANFEAPPSARRFAWSLVEAVCANTGLIDDRIAARSRNWRVSRMAAVDRNILRLGAYELGQTTAPSAVVIDEAVELARRYGSDSSPAFVNGILDALASDLRPDGDPVASRAGRGAS
jgi:N utilization substance protein B